MSEHPLKKLGYLARRDLATILDHSSPRGADWKGLSDRMGFSYDTVRALRLKESPTLALLEEWEREKGGEANLDNLTKMLDAIGCYEGAEICKERGYYLNPHHPLTPCNSIDPSRLDPQEIEQIRQSGLQSVDPNSLAKSLAKIRVVYSETNQESGRGRSGSGTEGDSTQLRKMKESLTSQRFDVFLSFAEEDQEFAEEVRHRIVSKLKLRVFVPSEDLMPGKVFHREIADMITMGCRKTIIILSPDYVESSWCNYEANLVINRSPDNKEHVLIPILYRKCDIPAAISPLYYCDYPKFKDDPDVEEFFWNKLYLALNHDPA